jgi:hypothetical protein
MTKQYLVIDFECLQPNEWQSVGIVLYEQATSGGGTLLRQFHTACNRGYASMTPSTRKFWKKNSSAFLYNFRQGKNKNVATEETAICRFILALKQEYPHFHLISDAPEYDIALINGILGRQNSSCMSHRSKNVYFQTICTWSSKKTLDMLGIPIQSNDQVGLENLTAMGLLAHTPIYDCMRILNEYLCVLDTISRYRALSLLTQSLVSL